MQSFETKWKEAFSYLESQYKTSSDLRLAIKQVHDLFSLHFADSKESEDQNESFVDTHEENFPWPKESSADYCLFSDGGCRGNPGPGAWACIAQEIEVEVEVEDEKSLSMVPTLFEKCGFTAQTTNNRMELKGAIVGFETLRDLIATKAGESRNKSEVRIDFYCDSKYVVDGMKSWRHNWKKRGWKKSDGKVPENVELWKDLDGVCEGLKRDGVLINFLWVKGHAGHPQNERCDQLCNQAMDHHVL